VIGSGPLLVRTDHSRRLIHYNVAAHPSAQWTRQQLREAIGYERRYEYLIHDRDSIFSAELDESIQYLGLRVLKSPPRSPTANAICERVIGTIRRECLDWLIPLSEAHLRQVLKSWIGHYNQGRAHTCISSPLPPNSQFATHRLRRAKRRAATAKRNSSKQRDGAVEVIRYHITTSSERRVPPLI
jgi:transposase InsO family protein